MLQLQSSQQPITATDPPAGILVAGCINLGAKDISPWGWRLPLAIAGTPSPAIQPALPFFMKQLFVRMLETAA